MPVFGMARSKALLFLADVLDTLSILARLVREATLACLLFCFYCFEIPVTLSNQKPDTIDLSIIYS